MKLEDQVVSLELAKRLKELGVKQESLWHYHGPEDHPFFLLDVMRQSHDVVIASAFTVAELGELLPPDTASEHTSNGGGLCWQIVSEDGDGDCFWDRFIDQEQEFSPQVIRAATEADARAKMLIYVIENGLLKENSNG